jgi:ABC-type Na+ transport system ATPase subunit NatA
VSREWYWPIVAPFQLWKSRRDTKIRDIEDSLPNPSSIAIQADKPEVPTTSSSTVPENDSTTQLGDSSAAIVVSLASKRFGKQYAIRDISLTVSSEEILALLGPNGAGKSTLVNCALGLYKLSSGKVTINGFDITRQHDQVYRHIGVCPQHEILWPELTVKEHLLFYCRLKGIDPKEEDAVVSRCMEEVDLLSEQNKLSRMLSGGQRRRLGIAIAIVARPAVVFLDEPTTGNPFENLINFRSGSEQ